MKTDERLYVKMQREVAALAVSISEVVGKFRELQNPLVESRERVPRATAQLDKISQQTEAATHQMLDRVEGISQRDEEIIQGLQDLREHLADGTTDECDGLIDILAEKAEANSNDAFMIMEALQFQDITSQQMNHAAALLEDVEARLHNILAVLQNDEPDSDAPKPKTKRKRVYDPHAELGSKRAVQADIDHLFAQKK